MAVSAFGRPAAAGVVAPQRGPIDPHTGLPVHQQTQADWDAYRRDQQLTQERNRFVTDTMGQNRPSYAMSWTDPRTGLTMNYDPSSGGGARRSASGSGAGAGELEDFDFNRSLAQVQPALPNRPAPAQLPPRVVGASPADAAAAQAAEFGRAKDRIGKLGRGSMTALNEEFSARGFGGSNMEASATQGLLSDLQGQEGEVVRDQAIQNLVRQRQVEDRNYAGDVNQRGQDIGFTTSTRGQDISAETARAQMQLPLLQLIAANRKRRTTPLY